MWGALARFVGAVASGDAEKAAEVLLEKPAEKPASASSASSGPDKGKGCGKRDGGSRCIAHTAEGACVMVAEDP